MNDQQIEQGIIAKGKTAARITPADINANIVSEHYFTARDGVDGADIAVLRAETPEEPTTFCPLSEDPDVMKTTAAPLTLLTFCVFVLRNGFTVTGESACASPENFDKQIGRDIARQNAINKVWPLMGYALKERLAALAELSDDRPVQSDPSADDSVDYDKP